MDPTRRASGTRRLPTFRLLARPLGYYHTTAWEKSEQLRKQRRIRDAMRKRQTTIELKPLWTCPRCRRQFANRNQLHSCGQFTVEQLLDGKPPEIVELYDVLSNLIQRCGDVITAPTKTRVLFKVRTVFASVGVSKNWLDVVFVLGRRLKHRRIKKAQQEYPGIVHSLRIEKAEDLDDDLVGWLQEAHDHCKKKERRADKK
jgi:hypothetical protein